MDLHRLTRSELARALGCTPRWISERLKAGMPSIADGSRRYFDCPACVAWLLARQRQDDGPSELEQARTREAQLRGDVLALDLATKRRELMTVADAQAVLADAFARVNARLLALPSRIAAVAWSGDMTERMRQAGPLVDEIRAELCAGDDAPEEAVA